MLEYIKSTERESIDIIRERYHKCQVLVIDLDLSGEEAVTGFAYALSRSEETFDELCELQQQMRDEGKLIMLVGAYEEDGLGVQYQVDP